MEFLKIAKSIFNRFEWYLLKLKKFWVGLSRERKRGMRGCNIKISSEPYWKSFINQHQNYARTSVFYTGSGIIFTGTSTILMLVYESFPREKMSLMTCHYKNR